MSTPTVEAALNALAQHLHNAGVATFAPNGIYTGPQTRPVVFIGGFPAAAPDSAVTINHYNTDPDYFTNVSNPLFRIQLCWRGTKDPMTAHRAADAAQPVITTQTPAAWPGGVHVLSAWRTISGLIYADQNGRWMRPDSYEIRLNPTGE